MDGLEPAVAETHVSYIFFAGDRAYKVKKPVNPGFLDFSTLPKRKAACEREVELNRRFAPDVYEGVATVLGPDGQPCEYVVIMRRMDPAYRLTALVRAGGAGLNECLVSVAGRIAQLHTEAPTGEQISRNGLPEAVLGRWMDNLSEISRLEDRPISDAEIDQLEDLARRFAAGRTPLFERRAAEGWVRDVHADLLADDIYCYPDGPRILDCIEFDDKLRWTDVADDVAFLAMDLERLGGGDPAEHLLAAYRKASADPAPATLLDFYIAYRALVRAKVACIRHAQGDGRARDTAHRLIDICRAHLRKAQVPMVLVGGLPGTGKSTLARALAERFGWETIRSDRIRRELFGSGAGAEYGKGPYSPEATEEVYRRMEHTARESLGMGRPVLLDASFASGEHRRRAAEVAQECASPVVQLKCVAPRRQAAARIDRRLSEGSDPSEATTEVADAMRSVADDWPEADEVDTSGSPEQSLSAATALLRRHLAF